MIGAYAHLNLRMNPFGELEPRHRAQLAVVRLDTVLAHLDAPRAAVQFVGACGRGKSTHLHALRAALPGAHYARLWTDQPDPAGLSGTVLLDEADAVGMIRRARLFRAAERLAIGVHRSFATELRLHGFRVHTVHVSAADPARLATLLRRRIEFARLAEGPIPTLPDHTVHALRARFGDDVRAMEDALYDAVHAMREVRDVAL
ncbi:MAG: hypothetical protein EP330_19485 [Deltaproteobacteria bacterium]|nr:MAG: hypothetical protein EP330_19485 [Deltaproteobacteria bacterium]